MKEALTVELQKKLKRIRKIRLSLEILDISSGR